VQYTDDRSREPHRRLFCLDVFAVFRGSSSILRKSPARASGYTLVGARIKLRRHLGDRRNAARAHRRATIATVQYDRRSPRTETRSGVRQAKMHSRDEVLDRIRSTLVELFELSPADVTPEARLYEDLEIDSIDVVDLMEEVHRRTGRKATPEDFRSVRTVGDLVSVMQRLMK
jgi:acyl carrier protein